MQRGMWSEIRSTSYATLSKAPVVGSHAASEEVLGEAFDGCAEG